MLIKIPSVSRQNGKTKQYLAAITVSISAFAVGTVLSWTSTALPYITGKSEELPTTYMLNNSGSQQFPNFTISHEQAALVGALLAVGALVSAVPSGCLADNVGRKKTLLTLAVPFLINWMLTTCAENINMLLFARFMAGISVGGFCVVAPMYISEIAEVSYRGTFGSFFQMFLCCGILFTTVIGSFTNWIGFALILGCVPIIFIILCCYLIPESPIYLLKKNKVAEAENALKELRSSEFQILDELNSMRNELQAASYKTVRFIGILRNKAYIRAFISVVGVLAFQQLSGINAIIFYTVSIFETAGSTFSPNVSSIIINLVQVVASYISILIIEKAGRKFYLMLSAVGMFLSLSSLGMFFHVKSIEVEVSGVLCTVPIISVILFMASFAVGFGPIPWMLMGELLAPEIKGPASGVAVLANWIFASVVTFAFPMLNSNVGAHVTFYIFSGFMASAIGFVHFVVPETKGKTLPEIQKDLSK